MKAKQKQNTEKRKQNAAAAAMLLVGVLVGAACGIFIARHMDIAGESGSIGDLALLFLALYASFFLHIIIHEGGHLVFGILSGYRFSSFRIGSLMLTKEEGRFRLRSLSLAGTAGQCLMLPPEPVDGKIPVLLYNFGGAIMNTLFSFMALGLYFSLGDGRPIGTACLIFALIGLFLAAMNGIPMRAGLVDNDGKNALSIAKSPEAMRAFYLQLKISEQTAAHVRLKDMPEEWFTLPDEKDMNNALVATMAVFAANRLLDAHRFDEADALMEKLTEGKNAVLGVHKGLLVCDRIYCETIRENRTEAIEKLLTKEQKKLMRSMKDYPSVLRTEYALAKSGGKGEAQAEAIRRRFEKRAEKFPYRGEIESEREFMSLVG